MSDSKGAAIDEIIQQHRFDVEKLPPAEAFAKAKQAILAILAQEVNKARIDELRGIPFKNKLTSGENEVYILERLFELERLG